MALQSPRETGEAGVSALRSQFVRSVMLEFFTQNQLFIVMTIILLIWAGIVWYLVRIDKRVKQLEDHITKG